MGQIKEGKGALIGNAGEHYTLAEFLRRGIVAGLLPRNTRGFDLIANIGNHSVMVRVKTRTDNANGWIWNAKGESPESDIFADFDPKNKLDLTSLVHIPKLGSISLLLVRTSVLDKVLKKSHKSWFDSPGLKGRKHRPTRMRRLIAGSEDDELQKRGRVNLDDLLDLAK